MTAVAANNLTPARYSGKVCAKHPEGNGLRRVGNHECVYCSKEAVKRWKLANPSRNRAHASKALAKIRNNDPNATSAYFSAWYENNKDKVITSIATRRAAKLQRTVAWADQDAIKAVYKEARATGMTVDHIIPLQGELVSGLHVDYNLQLLPASENFSKRNKFEPYVVRNI